MIQQAIWKDGEACCPSCESPVIVEQRTVSCKVHYGQWVDHTFYSDYHEWGGANEELLELYCAGACTWVVDGEMTQKLTHPEGWVPEIIEEYQLKD